MRRFLDAWPRIELELTESTSDDDLLRLVERGELDLTFAMLPLLEGPFEVQELLRDPYVLVVPADHVLASRERASLGELDGLAVIGNRACRSTSLAESELELRGLRPEISFRSDDNGTVQGLVAAGLGAALVPLLSVDVNDDRVRVLEVEPAIPERRIAIAWHGDRHRSPAARAFLELAAEVCADVRLELPQPVEA